MKILSTQWIGMGITDKSTVGVVLIENEVGGIKGYIGHIKKPCSEEADALYISKLGGKLTKDQTLAFFPEHKNRIEEMFRN